MNQAFRAIPTALLTLAAGLLVVVSPAPVQSQTNQGLETMPEAQEIDDGELRSFAEVYLDVTELRMALQERVQQMSDEAEAQQLQQEAQARMRTILEESPLTIERYTQIGQVLNVDPEQRAEFQAVVKEIQEEGEGGGDRI